MGWETRGGRTYYYTKIREGGRVRSEYRGAGEFAEIVALLDQEQRQEREAERLAWQAERKRMEEEERRIVEWFDAVESVADAAMFAAGFHQHKRQWRRRRNVRDQG